jgi:hypothetical protein
MSDGTSCNDQYRRKGTTLQTNNSDSMQVVQVQGPGPYTCLSQLRGILSQSAYLVQE